MQTLDYNKHVQYEVHYLTKKNEFDFALATDLDDAEQTLKTIWHEWAKGKPEMVQMRMMPNFYVDVVETEMYMAISAAELVTD